MASVGKTHTVTNDGYDCAWKLARKNLKDTN